MFINNIIIIIKIIKKKKKNNIFINIIQVQYIYIYINFLYC